jgi:hypothetical protein
MTFCAAVRPTADEQFFQIIPVAYSLPYSKAKLIAFDFLSPFGIDILNPWKAVSDGVRSIPMDDDLDLTISATLSGLWYEDKLAKVSQLGETQTFQFRRRKVGDPKHQHLVSDELLRELIRLDRRFVREALRCDLKDTKSKPKDEMSNGPFGSLENMFRKVIEASKKVPFELTSLLPKVPRVVDAGRGYFSFTVSVSEFDDYGKRIKELSAALDKRKEDWQKNLSGAFEGF